MSGKDDSLMEFLRRDVPTPRWWIYTAWVIIVTSALHGVYVIAGRLAT